MLDGPPLGSLASPSTQFLIRNVRQPNQLCCGMVSRACVRGCVLPNVREILGVEWHAIIFSFTKELRDITTS